MGVPGYGDGDGVRAPEDGAVTTGGSRDDDRPRSVGRTPASVQLLTRGKGGVRRPGSWDAEADLATPRPTEVVRGGSAKSDTKCLREGSADAVLYTPFVGVTEAALGVERPKFGEPERDGTWSVSSESKRTSESKRPALSRLGRTSGPASRSLAFRVGDGERRGGVASRSGGGAPRFGEGVRPMRWTRPPADSL